MFYLLRSARCRPLPTTNDCDHPMDLDLKRVLASAPRKREPEDPAPLLTPWGETLDPDCVLQEHPSPQFARENVRMLNGWWDYAITPCEKNGSHEAGSANGQGGSTNDQNGSMGKQSGSANESNESNGSRKADVHRADVHRADARQADAEHAWRRATRPSQFDGRILVPFSPEALLSGVNRELQPNELLWYRRLFFLDDIPAGHRVILHFEAVDYACTCYVNGQVAGEHVGGYLPFAFDITDALRENGYENELALCVYDPSDTGVQLRGKQKLEASGIWYTAQSGIWQSVWLEIVPENHLESIRLDACPQAETLTVTAFMQSASPSTGEPTSANEFATANEPAAADGCTSASKRAASEHTSASNPAKLEVRVFDAEGNFIAEAQASVEIQRDETVSGAKTPFADSAAGASYTARPSSTHAISLAIPISHPHLWSPDDPYLYQLELRYGTDIVHSYCAFRTLSMQRDENGMQRFCLNGQPLFLRGVLDQGYWSDGLMTAPSDDALIFDIQAMKDAGFNMLRKHIKVESARWYYHCDRLGMLVWQDMVTGGSPYSAWHTSYKPTLFRASWGRFDDSTPAHYAALSAGDAAYRDEWERTCRGTIEHLSNHPCIVTWVLFNEAWGQFEARRITEMVRTLDPTRPIDAVSGWYDQRCGDYLSVHNYFRSLQVYPDTAKRAFVISEFGGIVYHALGHTMLSQSYGYEVFDDAARWREALATQLATVDALEPQGLAGYVYTQLSDVEEETNGILTYDRRVNKLDNAPIA